MEIRSPTSQQTKVQVPALKGLTLRLGETLAAVVQARFPENRFLLELIPSGNLLSAYSPTELELGQRLKLEVVRLGTMPELRLILPEPQVSTSEAPIQQALRQFLPKQESLSELTGMLIQLNATSGNKFLLSPPLQTAIDHLLAVIPQKNQLMTPEGLKEAIRNSGLFLEAKLSGSPILGSLNLDLKTQLLRLLEALKTGRPNLNGKIINESSVSSHSVSPETLMNPEKNSQSFLSNNARQSFQPSSSLPASSSYIQPDLSISKDPLAPQQFLMDSPQSQELSLQSPSLSSKMGPGASIPPGIIAQASGRANLPSLESQKLAPGNQELPVSLEGNYSFRSPIRTDPGRETGGAFVFPGGRSSDSTGPTNSESLPSSSAPPLSSVSSENERLLSPGSQGLLPAREEGGKVTLPSGIPPVPNGDADSETHHPSEGSSLPSGNASSESEEFLSTDGERGPLGREAGGKLPGSASQIPPTPLSPSRGIGLTSGNRSNEKESLLSAPQKSDHLGPETGGASPFPSAKPPVTMSQANSESLLTAGNTIRSSETALARKETLLPSGNPRLIPPQSESFLHAHQEFHHPDHKTRGATAFSRGNLPTIANPADSESSPTVWNTALSSGKASVGKETLPPIGSLGLLSPESKGFLPASQEHDPSFRPPLSPNSGREAGGMSLLSNGETPIPSSQTDSESLPTSSGVTLISGDASTENENLLTSKSQVPSPPDEGVAKGQPSTVGTTLAAPRPLILWRPVASEVAPTNLLPHPPESEDFLPPSSGRDPLEQKASETTALPKGKSPVPTSQVDSELPPSSQSISSSSKNMSTKSEGSLPHGREHWPPTAGGHDHSFRVAPGTGSRSEVGEIPALPGEESPVPISEAHRELSTARRPSIMLPIDDPVVSSHAPVSSPPRQSVDPSTLSHNSSASITAGSEILQHQTLPQNQANPELDNIRVRADRDEEAPILPGNNERLRHSHEKSPNSPDSLSVIEPLRHSQTTLARPPANFDEARVEPILATTARPIQEQESLPTDHSEVSSQTQASTDPAGRGTEFTPNTDENRIHPTLTSHAPQLQDSSPTINDRASASDLPPSSSEPPALEHLAHKVENTLAKLVLDQLASLPKPDSSALVWRLEIPFTDHPYHDAAQLLITQEEKQNTLDASDYWSVTLELHPPGLGTFYGRIVLNQGKIDTYLWSDQTSTAELIRSNEEHLAARLQQAGLSVGHLATLERGPNSRPQNKPQVSLLDLRA